MEGGGGEEMAPRVLLRDPNIVWHREYYTLL
jgi:hypothetical protein